MFEMLFGGPPFSDERHDPAVTSARVSRWRQHFHMPADPRVGEEARDLIRGLICDPQDRLGADEIRSHPFFKGLDFSKLREIEPPIKPVVSGPLDTSNFDDFSGADKQYGVTHVRHQVVKDPTLFAFHDYGYTRELEAKKPSVTAALSSAVVTAASPTLRPVAAVAAASGPAPLGTTVVLSPAGGYHTPGLGTLGAPPLEQVAPAGKVPTAPAAPVFTPGGPTSPEQLMAAQWGCGRVAHSTAAPAHGSALAQALTVSPAATAAGVSPAGCQVSSLLTQRPAPTSPTGTAPSRQQGMAAHAWGVRSPAAQATQSPAGSQPQQRPQLAQAAYPSHSSSLLPPGAAAPRPQPGGYSAAHPAVHAAPHGSPAASGYMQVPMSPNTPTQSAAAPPS
eukprot:CAMPEP_0180443038 /NCGR_PEP_ID=MMETSP1036_2-20121128/14459_1 /TAXON_ID=632150 /ORGANISM="Azadinium spinosum, Strain 3D9" /LENGTH=391 /DNA_ID=CAMNT_0022449319 /DNA_START=9 /DNA_END=1181 /DNA_ORIENTATION=-